LKLIVDELQTRQQIVTSDKIDLTDSPLTFTDTGNDELYENIFDKMSQDNDGDTRYDEKTRELSIYFDSRWHRAKIDTITEAIRKKNMGAYEVLEEMLKESGINAN